VVLEGLPPLRSIRWRLARWTLFAAIGLVNAGLVGGLALYAWFSRGLPSVPTLAEYRPPIITEMMSADGQIAGEFFVERRKVIPIRRIPGELVQAFIASEDKNFFEHGGVDWLGTLRAAVNTYVLRKKIQGGSTISQQTAKSLLISAEGFREGTRKSLARKLREAILASRLERAFTKEQILFLYLNGVYLGHHSYGVQSAAENYYRKNAEDLTLPEAALLAGLPQAPSRYSPFAHPDQAKARRRYVLRRMRQEGMITEEQRRTAEEAEVKVHKVDDIFRETAPFYVEQVRRQIVERYGNERMLHDGLRVEMAMDLEAQRAAQAAMLPGLMEVDHRQGWLGPVKRVEGAERRELEARLAQVWPAGSLQPGDYAVGVVRAVSDAEGQARVLVGGQEGILPIAGMRWARKPNSEVFYPGGQISRVSAALKAGDVILVRRVTRKELSRWDMAFRDPRSKLIPEAGLLLALEQEPKLQGALVSLDPWSGYVSAMVGGYDFDASEFNRAFQACRQPGSAFKPIVYTAAFEKLGYTPATVLLDAPLVYRDDESAWKPQNYGESFKGEVTLRDALIHSMIIPRRSHPHPPPPGGPPPRRAGFPVRHRDPGRVGQERGALHAGEARAGQRHRQLLHHAVGPHRRLCPPRPLRGEAAQLPGEARAGPRRPGAGGSRRLARSLGAAPGAAGGGSRGGLGRAPAGHGREERLPRRAPHAGSGHRRNRRPGGTAREARRRQDRDHQRLLRYLVPRLHPRSGHRRVAGVRPQRDAARPLRDRRAGGAAHLAGLHAASPAREAPAPVPGARRHRHGLHRSSDREGGFALRPQARGRALRRGDRAAAGEAGQGAAGGAGSLRAVNGAPAPEARFLDPLPGGT
jgi:membrane carboxypeptidase/penicillin-binding protein